MSIKKSLLDIIFVLGLFTVLHILVFVLAKGTQVISINHLPNQINSIWTSVPTILAAIFVSIKFKNYSWDSYENFKIIRGFILIVAGTIFWEQFFLDYNYFHNSNMFLEKLFLVLSIVLIYFNPSWVVVFLTQSLLIWQSHQEPLGGFHLTDIRPVFELLTMFITFQILKKYRNIHTNIFIFLALTLHVSNYFVPGIVKLEISPNGWEWIFLNELNNLFVSSYINGWLGFIDEKTAIYFAGIIDHTEVIAQVITLLIHLGSIFLLCNKRITLLLFLGFELLHLGIFFASGIFFWAWILINFGFIYLLKRMPKESIRFLYSKKSVLTFCFIVVFSPIFYQPTALGWWDSRVNTIYDFVVTTEDGNKFKLNKNDFSPYDLLFTQNRFYYASNEKILSNTYGVIQRDEKTYSRIIFALYRNTVKSLLGKNPNNFPNDSYFVYHSLQKAKNLEEVKRIVNHFGKNYFDKNKKQTLENFIKNYFKNLNSFEKKHAWYTKLGAPYHIYDLSQKRFQGKKRIVKVEVIKYNTWWNKNERKIIRYGNKKIMDINVE